MFDVRDITDKRNLAPDVTDALLCLLKGAQKSDADAQLAALLQGVQRRLSSALPAVRSQGMRVAEALSAVATPELPLKFDVEMDDGEAVKKEPKEAYNMDTTSVVTEPAVAKDNKKSIQFFLFFEKKKKKTSRFFRNHS